MNRRDILLGLICWLLVLFTAACSDELGGYDNPSSSSGNLRLLVPTILSANGNDQSDNSSNNTTYNATVDECQINDLKLYAFPVDADGNATGTAIVEQLTAPIASNMLDEHIATYQLRINPGKYHIYAVANMAEALDGKTFDNEDALKKVVLEYNKVGGVSNLPTATNIPMIYEPKDINGNLLTTDIPEAGDKYTTVAANLKFTCVKVKLNLIFDPNAEHSAFNGKSYSIKEILAQKLSPSTTLSWDGKFTNSSVSTDYAEGFSNQVFDSSSSESSEKGGYYKDGEWTEDESNAKVNDKDIITLADGAIRTAAPTNAAAKWLFQGTYYLPERYIANADQQSTLKVTGSVNGSNDNNYTIKLGLRQDENSTSEVPTFPRGTYYEIVGKIKTLGNIDLNCQVSVKDWTPVQIDADFNHTTLWVSKTKASVTSTTTDSINYESNVELDEKTCFGCDNKVTTSTGEKDVIVLTKLDAENHRITFNINKDIKFADYNGNYKGTAKVWIKAGNIKKYLNVEYDAAPYFDVDPQEVTIYWGSDNNTKVVEFKTNLGGLAFTNSVTSSTVGKSTIQASCENPDTSDGSFKIVATTDPVTTTVHYLTVQPKESAEGFNFVKKIKVTVKPAVGNYRINFRAINDRIPYAGASDPTKSSNTGNFKGVLTEGEANNWNDGWFEETWSGTYTVPHETNHCIYVYTQIGETTGTTVNSPVWYFTTNNNWPGDNMSADNTNTGWYYKDFNVNLTATGHNQYASDDSKKIKPGETLIMFSNNYNKTVGYTVHRCPHHMEPGIPLFDYEDCEGWIVYDPTSDPTWHVYDDMPTIENVAFTLYTKMPTYGWFKVYGIAKEINGNESNREQFTIYDNNKSEGNKSWTCTNLNNGWYKTVITLKAVKGDHEKDIRVKIDTNDSNGKSILLFNGNSYEKYGDVGYYEGSYNDDYKASSWHAGKPSGVN